MVKLAFVFPFSLLLTLVIQTCYCYRNIQNCIANPSSSCGDLPSIAFPFRLTADPNGCGSSPVEISCDNNIPIWISNKSDKYIVRSINYNNNTIRLFDTSLAPLSNNPISFCNHSQTTNPHHISSLGEGNILHDYIYYDYGPLYQSLVIISCPSSLLKSRKHSHWAYVDDSAICSPHNHHNYWYARFGDYVRIEDLQDSCRVELIALTSLPPKTSTGNISFQDIRDSLEYGFELTWEYWLCWYNHPTYYGRTWCVFKEPGTPWMWKILQTCASAIYTILVTFGIYESPKDVPGYLMDEKATILPYLFSLYVLLHVALLFIGAPLLVVLLVYKWRRRHLSFYDNIEDFLQNTYDQLMPVRYSYKDIKKITKGFKDKLGEGGYGSVYKGKLRSGQTAAVKMLGKVDTDGNDFINEVATIGRVHHFNVVRLIGFCAEGSKRALVYPFMPNGSLDKYIFPPKKGDMNNVSMINNNKMYEIALGVACGIEYLHRGCDMQILHFDIKPHNILLDENFVPKVADFGLAKLYPTNKSIVSLTAIKGTIGYMAPEFFYRSVGGISYKADVYSFGRMLMEMATRSRNPISFAEHSDQIFLPSRVHDQFTGGNYIELADITDEVKEIIEKMIIVGLWCVQLRPDMRPSMHKVIQMLQSRICTLQLPPKPSFAPPYLLANVEGVPTTTTSTSQLMSSMLMTNESLTSEDLEVLLESDVIHDSIV